MASSQSRQVRLEQLLEGSSIDAPLTASSSTLTCWPQPTSVMSLPCCTVRALPSGISKSPSGTSSTAAEGARAVAGWEEEEGRQRCECWCRLRNLQAPLGNRAQVGRPSVCQGNWHVLPVAGGLPTAPRGTHPSYTTFWPRRRRRDRAPGWTPAAGPWPLVDRWASPPAVEVGRALAPSRHTDGARPSKPRKRASQLGSSFFQGGGAKGATVQRQDLRRPPARQHQSSPLRPAPRRPAAGGVHAWRVGAPTPATLLQPPAPARCLAFTPGMWVKKASGD